MLNMYIETQEKFNVLFNRINSMGRGPIMIFPNNHPP